MLKHKERAMIKNRIELVILDRDGVINYDSKHYIKSPQELKPIPDSIEAIAKLKRLGFKVAIATNQSGIARGFFSHETLSAMHNKILSLLQEHNATIDAINYCPHLPNEGCDCRKPKPGLLTAAMEQLNVRNINTIMIGDSGKDIVAAENAGCRAALVLTGNGEDTYHKYPNSNVFANLAECVESLTSQL